MTDHISTLRIDLTGNITPEARVMGEALLKAAADAKRLDETLEASGASRKMQERLRALGASAEHVDGVTAALRHYAEAEELAASRKDWTKEQAAGFRVLEQTTVSGVKAQIAIERAHAELRRKTLEDQVREAKRVADEEVAIVRRREEAEAAAVRRGAEERRRAHEAEIREERRHAERMVEQRAHMQERMGVGHYALGGIAAGVSAHGVMSGVEAAGEKGAELQDTRLAMRNSGISPDLGAKIEQQALELSRRYANVGQAAIMDLAKEARSVLKEDSEIGPTTEVLARAKAALDATGGHSEGLGDLVKGAESIGAAQNPERLAKLVDGYVKAIQVMGHTISPEQIYEFDKYAKTAGATMSDRFLMTTGLSLSQELGGSTAANDVFHAQKDIVGGFQNKHIPLKEMARLGLLNQNDIETLPGTGENKGVRAGARGVANKELAQTDLDLWVYKTLLPALEGHGIRTEMAQLAEVSKIFTGGEADVISKLITQRSSFENHADKYGRAAGSAAADTASDSATAGVNALTTAIGNLASNVTVEAMAPIGHVLYGVAEALDHLAEIAAAHPVDALGVGALAGGLALGASGYVGMKVMNGFGFGGGAANSAAAAEQVTAAGTQVTAAEMQLAAAGKSAAGGVAGTVAEVAKDGALGVTAAGLAAGVAAVAAPIALAIVAAKKDKDDREAFERTKDSDAARVLPDLSDQTFLQRLWGTLPPRKEIAAGDLPGSLFGVSRRYSEEARARALDERAASPASPDEAPTSTLSPSDYWARKRARTGLGDPNFHPTSFDPGGEVDRSRAPLHLVGTLRTSDPGTAEAPDGAAGGGFTPAAYRTNGLGADDGDRAGAFRDAVEGGTEAGVVAAFAKLGIGAGFGGDGDAGDDGGGGSGPDRHAAASIRYGRQHSGPGGGVDVGGRASAMSGDVAGRAHDAIGQLEGLGWSHEAAAAAVGNAQQESGVRSDGPLGDTKRFGTGDDAAHGMFQWRGQRFRDLKAFAGERGKEWTDFKTQVAFFDQESKKYGSAEWRQSHDIVHANQGMKRFEGYGDDSFGTRLANARQLAAGKSDGGFYAPDAPSGGPGGGGAAPTGDAVGIAGSLLGQREAGASRALNHVMHAGEWCADFVNGTIEKAGGRGSGSAMASSFMSWGKSVAIADAKRGDVIMENSGRGTHVHHAGLVESVDRDKSGAVTGIHMISGNYGHMVKRNLEPFGIIAGLRRGNEGGPGPAPAAGTPIFPRAGAAGRPDHAAEIEPRAIFDHENIHGAIHAVRQLKRELADLGDASVSVVRSTAPGGRGSPRPSAVGRTLRGGAAATGTRLA